MELTVRPLDRRISARAGANLLEVLTEHNIPVSYSCMAGRCGTCRCKLVAGEVLASGQMARGPNVSDDGQVLACQTVLTGDCTIEIAEPDEVVIHPARIAKASVISIEEMTHDVKRLLLRPAKPFEFSPGQYAQLQFTPEHVRPYSMAGLPGDEVLEFHVRCVPGGRVTSYIAQALKIGDAVRVSGPLGTSYLRRRHDGPMLCVAGGTGLAPVLSILRGALDAGLKNEIHVYVGARSAKDMYGLSWLRALASDYRRLHLHFVTTASSDDPSLRHGLVTEVVAADWKRLDGWRAYLCGAPPMVEAATLLVRQRGVANEHIYADAFYSSGI